MIKTVFQGLKFFILGKHLHCKGRHFFSLNDLEALIVKCLEIFLGCHLDDK